jgi:hypothetical protein
MLVQGGPRQHRDVWQRADARTDFGIDDDGFAAEG